MHFSILWLVLHHFVHCVIQITYLFNKMASEFSISVDLNVTTVLDKTVTCMLTVEYVLRSKIISYRSVFYQL